MKDEINPKAIGYYEPCNNAVGLSGYDEEHRIRFKKCPICGIGKMTEIHKVV